VSGIENAKLHAARDERDLVLANDRFDFQHHSMLVDLCDAPLILEFD
jgi:hypothetical protein